MIHGEGVGEPAAHEPRRGADAARVAATAALLARDFATAWKQYQRSRSLNGG